MPEAPATTNHPHTRANIHSLAHLCTRLRGSACNRCELACPHGAITFSADSIVIDRTLCTRCGICVGICDAFCSEHITTADLYAKALRILADKQPLFITCNDHLPPGFEPSENVLVIPCLAALSPEFWTALLVHPNPIYVYRNRAYCSSCAPTQTQGEALYTHALEQAQQWAGREVVFVDTLPEKGSIINRYAAVSQTARFDRRGIFTSLLHEVDDITSGAYRKRTSESISEFHEQRERMRAQGEIAKGATYQASSTPLTWPRRQMLCDALKRAPERARYITRYVSTTHEDACTGQRYCIAACPSKARMWDNASQRVVVDANACLACGICIAACPEGACDYQPINAAES